MVRPCQHRNARRLAFRRRRHGPTDAAQVFWFNTADNTLYYDADGNGVGSAIAVAVLDNGFVLNHTDLVLA
jgi:hypothetical protein